MRYHPGIGYTYMPNAKLRVQGAHGGYLVRTNAAGYRSEREFVPDKRPDVFRVMLFGDSQTAGDGTSNAFRYSDLLERAVPNLEVYNYALSGTATDQQFLAFKENASVQHDLIVIGLFVENIRRVSRRIIKARDVTGEEYLRPKPYYELEHDQLVLHNVPVPPQTWTEETLPRELLPHVYAFGEENSFFKSPSTQHASVIKRLVPAGPVRSALKALVSPFRKWNPLPDYDSPQKPGWLLLRKILAAWIAESKVPVLVVPLPHDSSFTGLSDPSSYQARFRELARDTGCRVFDPLPDLMKLDDPARAALWSTDYGHFSVQGHEAIARLLTPVVRQFMSGRAQT
ncbi:SGNH/GDSL hydrolase family protein [Methylibium sp.]|uniref:SGNH/GDSL hydrolase family protein n=1 Tax=Methylibium sp. TaxID=2067992 RepID=UPI003D0D7125